MKETEHKFLVTSEAFKKEAFQKQKIEQGYLNTEPERTVRVRTKGEKAFITVKGKSNKSGLSRFEWEQEIQVKDAQKLLKLCEPGLIEKTRYLVKCGEHTFEVDEFYGDNAGLIIAEVELGEEGEHFQKPDWIGADVSDQTRYSNSSLTKNPYKNW